MTDSFNRPIRVLHVVGSMLGGVGLWVRDVCNYIDRDRFHIDFLIYHKPSYPYPRAITDQVTGQGAAIIECAPPERPWAFAWDFKRILREHGPYDIVHSHPHLFSGLVLKIAQQAGVLKRLAHSHTNVSSSGVQRGLWRRMYLLLMHRWLNLYATGGLAASQAAAADLFGPRWASDSRWRVLPCGIDLAPWAPAVDPQEVRGELGIPSDAFVVGHVGALWEVKNQKFLVEVASEVAKRIPGTHLLLVGDGPLRTTLEQQVKQLGLGDRVIFAGFRSDIPRLLQGAMDIFVFPSLSEGLGLALVEAQAAGLICVFSDIVPPEADVVTPLVRRLSLSQPPPAWAEAILQAWEAPAPITRKEALARVESSPFNIRESVRKLEGYYECGG